MFAMMLKTKPDVQRFAVEKLSSPILKQATGLAFPADRVGVCLCCGRVGSIPPMMHVCRVCFAELEAER